MKAFGIFIVGALLASAGVAIGLHQLGVSATWIAISVLIVLGIAIASGAKLMRPRSSTHVNVDTEEASEH